jgi:hypothetical protein
MRNKWFPARVADYVPAVQLKQLKLQDIDISRDASFGVRAPLEEIEENEEVVAYTRHVRPIEIDVLSVCLNSLPPGQDWQNQPDRSTELLDAFIPHTIDFYRQRIEQERNPQPRAGASSAADILTAAAMAGKSKAHPDAIYGSVSTADVVHTIRGALAHNDEASRVILHEKDVEFLSGYEEEDASRVKQLGVFKIKIRLQGAKETLVRSIRIRERTAEA